MKYFTRVASQQLGNRKGSSRWDGLWVRYGQKLARIRNQLTPGWRELADIEFHDTSIFAVERPSASELIFRVDMSPRHGQPPERICTLRFLDVRHTRIPESVIGDWWLYTEVHLTADGCGDLQVLLHKTEMQIIAPDVGIFRNYNE